MSVDSEINELRRKIGRIPEAKDVVAFAKANPKSALHQRFDWDNEVAGDKWRLQQATAILATVKYEPYEGKEYRATVVTIEQTEDGKKIRIHESTEDLLKTPGGRAKLAAEILQRMLSCRTNYDLEELGPTVEFIKAEINRIEKLLNAPTTVKKISNKRRKEVAA